ncbi:MAG TPA: hypothetical protein VMK66_01485 [Myxococcales bacterium]|nr:hypothetical protein [Myxococcales bacterium]
MAGRLTRFLNLERPRAPGEKPHEVATRGRFTGEPPELAVERDFGDQPFLRCPRCQTDNSRYAQRCGSCATPLDSEEAQAFNDRLWTERKAERAREEVALRQRRPSEAELLQQNRMLGEALAREVGQREWNRLSFLGWGSGGYYDPTPIGFRLLSLLPSLQAKIVAGALAVVTFIGAVTAALAGRGHPRVQGAGFVVGVLLLLLFTPNLPRRRRWWW